MGHGLQFAEGDVFPDLAIRGAHGVVAYAGKLAGADVVGAHARHLLGIDVHHIAPVVEGRVSRPQLLGLSSYRCARHAQQGYSQC